MSPKVQMFMPFVDKLVAAAKSLTVGNGLDSG